MGFIPAGKAEFLKGAEEAACAGLGGFLLNQLPAKLRSAPEIRSDQEETNKKFSIFLHENPTRSKYFTAK